MKAIVRVVAIASLSFTTILANAKELLIEDFSEYASTEELQENWNAFGNAASSGPATLEESAGESGSNAALFQLNWDAGNNANMRLKTLPASKQDLSDYETVEVTLKLEADSMGYNKPNEPTGIRLVIQGGPDSSIWQTDSYYKKSPKLGEYSTLVFALSDDEMARESGQSTLKETLSKTNNLRLRFENNQAADAREDALVQSVVAKD